MSSPNLSDEELIKSLKMLDPNSLAVLNAHKVPSPPASNDGSESSDGEIVNAGGAREVQHALEGGLGRNFLDGYGKENSCALLKGRYKFTIVHKNWGPKELEAKAVPMIVIDGPGAYDPNYKNPSSPGLFHYSAAPKVFALPKTVEEMPDQSLGFDFKSQGVYWSADDIKHNGEVWELMSYADPNSVQSKRTIGVVFGDCNKLTSDQRLSVNEVLHEFALSLATSLGGSLMGTWEHDWSHVWIKSSNSKVSRIVLIGPGIMCKDGVVRVDPPTKNFFNKSYLPFSFTSDDLQGSPYWSEVTPVHHSTPHGVFHPIDTLKSTTFSGWSFYPPPSLSELPEDFTPADGPLMGRVCVQVVKEDECGFWEEQLGNLEVKKYQY
ncbi:hypothetical protein T439DRAFT_354862 [Meredithblackwellia eburnea MCA 4105]